MMQWVGLLLSMTIQIDLLVVRLQQHPLLALASATSSSKGSTGSCSPRTINERSCNTAAKLCQALTTLLHCCIDSLHAHLQDQPSNTYSQFRYCRQSACVQGLSANSKAQTLVLLAHLLGQKAPPPE